MSAELRILAVIETADLSKGGPIEALRQFARQANEWGHTVELLTLDATPPSWAAEFGLQVHALGPAFSTYGYCRALPAWLRTHASEYDAVVVRGLWQYLGFAVWRRLRDSSTPYFVYVHGMLDPWFRRQYPLKHVKKALYWKAVESRVLRDAGGVLFTSEEERLRARDAFSPYALREVVVKYGTVSRKSPQRHDTQKFYSRFPVLQDKPFFLFLGRLHEKKGCAELLQAFLSLSEGKPQYRLLFAGPGEQAEKERLQRLAAASPFTERVLFADALFGEEKWGALSAAEVFVLPSHQENFGIAVTEALSCGTPVLVSTEVNIWRELLSAEAGFVAEDSLEGTITLLQRWLSLPQAERDAMRYAARKCFEECFSLEEATEDQLEVLGGRR